MSARRRPERILKHEPQSMMEGSKERSMRILICEDNHRLRAETTRLIGAWGHDTHGVADGPTALVAIQQDRWDLVLTDLRLPGGVDGLQILRTLRQVDPDAACVILTAWDSAETAVEAMTAGAFDYLIKPVTVDRLWNVVERIEDRGDLLQRLRVVEQESLTDQLTGIGNYRAVHGALDALLESHSDQPAAIAIADLDNFRLLNDTLGHLRCDEILKQVGAELAAAVGRGHVCGRLSGDQFMVVMPGADAEQAQRTMERVRAGVESIEVQGNGGLPIPLSLTSGVGLWPDDGPSKTELLQVVEITVRQAKRAGGSRTSVHGPESMPAVSLRSFSALTGLVQALDSRDHYTYLHSEHATRHALRMAKLAGCTPAELREIEIAGPIHDLGKIVVPDSILRKPGPLTPDEWAQMQQHSSIGAVIAASLPDLAGMVEIIRHHHERWDGQGYPAGIGQNDISRVVRIFSLGDAFSAMVTTRPYRKAMDLEVALEEIKRGAGSQFDPELAEAFLALSWEDHNLSLAS